MIRYSIFIALIVLIFGCDQDDTVVYNPLGEVDDRSQCDFETPLYPGLSNDSLQSILVTCFRPVNEFNYTQARNFLYSEIDVINGEVLTIYSNYSIEIIPEENTSDSFIDAAGDVGINTEHVFPQSQGAGQLPARADMYHIYPERDVVNSSRSFLPFGNVSESSATNWFRGDMSQSNTPSDPENWARRSSTNWEPSDDKKGDVARSVFYFALIYADEMNEDYFEGMRETLLEWHTQDPVDAREATRAERVRARQGNFNPFIIDEGLAERVFSN